jgi:Tol biopolymer transport system component/DNA-binding winged helix-turn-helix (wHTH) protein
MNLETPRFSKDSVVDLAQEANFTLGSLSVIPSSREVTRGGQCEALEPRVMQVLVALYRAKGAVVSRDELITRCWEGRTVGEDSINRAIWRLRKLAEADGGANFTIETIPRIGYRLRASQPLVATEDGSAEAMPARRRKPLWAAASVAIVAIAAAAAWLLWPEPKWSVETSRPFLSSLEEEGEPAFSPDGTQLAYSSGTALTREIYVRSLAGGDSIKISTDDYYDASPSWSSDGSHLVYVASESGEPCRIMLATVPAGGVREVGHCRKGNGSSVAWQPGTRFVYFFDSQDNGIDGIYRLNLDTGARDTIIAPTHGVYGDLRCSPDGRWLLYIATGAPAGTNRVIVRDLISGQEKIVARVLTPPTEVWHNSAAWSEDSKTVLVSVANGGGSDITAFPLNGDKSYKVYSSASPISHLAAGRGGRLAAEVDFSRKNLARASPTPAQQPDQLDIASGISFSPSFARDGTMVFLSNRNGANALWIKRPGKSPALLFDVEADAPVRAAIAPDGRHIAVVNLVLNHENQVRILTADGAGSGYFNISALGIGFPTWTPDSKALVIYDDKSGGAVRVEIDDPAHRTPVAPPPWKGVTVRDNGTYAALVSKPGVWRIDGGEKLISAKYPRFFFPPLTFRGSDIVIPDFSAEGGARFLAQPISGGPDRVLAYAPGAEDLRYQSSFAVDPTNGDIIYVASIVNDTNIDLLTLVRH